MDTDQQYLLDREGEMMTFEALYRFKKNRHQFEPAVRYINDDHDGAALAKKGYSPQLTYLYLSPKVVLDANLIYGVQEANDVHSIYGKVLDTEHWGATITAFILIMEFKSSRLSELLWTDGRL